jgi:uncharacterized protein YodC (DUF2158 family)
MINTTETEFSLGDIVTYITHPYLSQLQNITIGGEAQNIPPLMTVVEIAIETKSNFDEHTGHQTSKKGNANCKCIWYSGKTAQFEEAWISSKFLRIIKQHESKDAAILQGSIVVLNTLKFELSKRKTSLKFEGVLEPNAAKTTIAPLLSFVGPTMVATEVKKNESKDGVYDANTGKLKRIIPNNLIKCKWFNATSDKFSEKLIPAEALYMVPSVSEETLATFQNNIKAKKHLLVTLDSGKTILQLREINWTNGFYNLRAYDFITNSIINVDTLDPDRYQHIMPFLNDAPIFVAGDLDGAAIIPEYTQLIGEAIADKNYLRIKYRNLNDKITIRTLSSLEITADKEDGKHYLTGYCHLRCEKRTFRVDRIQKMQVLNLNYSEHSVPEPSSKGISMSAVETSKPPRPKKKTKGNN